MWRHRRPPAAAAGRPHLADTPPGSGAFPRRTILSARGRAAPPQRQAGAPEPPIPGCARLPSASLAALLPHPASPPTRPARQAPQGRAFGITFQSGRGRIRGCVSASIRRLVKSAAVSAGTPKSCGRAFLPYTHFFVGGRLEQSIISDGKKACGPKKKLQNISIGKVTRRRMARGKPERPRFKAKRACPA